MLLSIHRYFPVIEPAPKNQYTNLKVKISMKFSKVLEIRKSLLMTINLTKTEKILAKETIP